MIENEIPREEEPEAHDESAENLPLPEKPSDESSEMLPPPKNSASELDELPLIEQEDGEPSETPPVPTAEEEEEQKKKPGLLRRIFRWFLVFLILISIGAILALYLLYIPQRDDLGVARRRIDEISTQSALDLENAQAEIDRLSIFESQNQVLSEQNEQILLQLTMLQIRTDVLMAQIDVIKGNNEEALLVLSNTPEELSRLSSLLPDKHNDFIESLQKRLDLALDGIERGDATAETDLNVLIIKMLELEDAILR